MQYISINNNQLKIKVMCKICKLLKKIPLRVEHIKEIKEIWENMNMNSQIKESEKIFKKMEKHFFQKERTQLNQLATPHERCNAAIKLLVKVNSN